MKEVGFWNNWRNEYPEYPMPVENKANYNVERMFDYLSNGVLAGGYRGTSHCRICRVRAGSKEYIDGFFLWPEGLPHYIKEHQIELPSDFVNHVESNGYSIKNTIDSIKDERIKNVMGILADERIPLNSSARHAMVAAIRRK
jgi:hypothetical protein